MQAGLWALARRVTGASSSGAAYHSGVEIVGSVAPGFKPWYGEAMELGKHDPRSRRGKVFNGTFGKSRPKKKPLSPYDPRSLVDNTHFNFPPPPNKAVPAPPKDA